MATSEAKRTWLILWIILAFGAGLRLAYLQEARQLPDFERPTVDAAFHDYWARALVSGDWTPPAAFPDPGIRDSPFFRPPGYPYALAGVYLLFGDGYMVPRLVQAALGLASALLAFLLARRFLGAVPALLTAAGMGFSGSLVYFEAELQATVWFVFLTLAFLSLVTRWMRRPALATALAGGGVAGLGTLVRPNFLAVVAAAVVWMVLAGRLRERRTIAAVAGLIATALLVVTPATVRNYAVSGAFVPVSANSGINLYIGNNPQADGFVASELPGLGTFGTSFDWPAIVRALETDDAGADRWFLHESLDFVADNPGRFVELTVKKALLFWGPAEVGHNKEVHFEKRASRWLRRLPGAFPWLLALALPGAAMLLRDENEGRRALARLLLLTTAAYFLSVLPFFAGARYRLPVVPLLLPPAGWALYRFGAAVRARRWQAALAGLAFAAAVAVVASRPFVDYAPSAARWHYDRAVAFEGVGELDRALAEYRLSLREDVTFFYSRYNLGHLLATLGRDDEAAEQWEAALKARANYAPTHYNLGLAYLRLGQRRRAAAHLEQALRLRPESGLYRRTLREIRENNN